MPSRPASVMTKLGTPNAGAQQPEDEPGEHAAAMREHDRDDGSGSPVCTNATASIADASPLTEPTDRSISPSSSTSTMPMPSCRPRRICMVRLTRLGLERKVGFSDLERRPR